MKDGFGNMEITILDKITAELVKSADKGDDHISEYLTTNDLIECKKALERQTKKFVIEVTDKYGKKHDECPNCHHWIEDCYGYTHCNCCGQRVSFANVMDT